MKIESYKAERHEFPMGSDVKDPAPGIMQVVYEEGKPMMVDFLCPCGCGSTCPIRVVPTGEATSVRVWSFDERTMTLHPSVRFRGGCKSHFNITNGRVVWHSDSGK